eukprot:gene19099-19459_t
MFMIEIDGIRVLYTGDYSLENDRHLVHAEVPEGGPPDVLIVESTFGTDNIPPREKRERDFTRTVESIVRRGGSCLIPVFALGRAQELLLILDEYWQQHPDLQNIPIFYASKLASKSLRVYQTFINMMNEHIRELMDQFQNPFKLKFIRSLTNQADDFDVFGPSVVMASPGFLQSGMKKNWSTAHKPSIATPENGVQVKLRFRKSIVADVLGSVAERVTQTLSGKRENEGQLPENTLLVTEHFSSKVVAGSELSQHSSFRFCNIWQRQVLAASYLEEVFDRVDLVKGDRDSVVEKKVKDEEDTEAKGAEYTASWKVVVEEVVTLRAARDATATEPKSMKLSYWAIKALAIEIILGVSAAVPVPSSSPSAQNTVVINKVVQSDHIINLAEVQLFSKGSQVSPNLLTFTLSSSYASNTVGSYCDNGIFTDYCHTSLQDTNPTLVINSPQAFDTVVVYNRAN